MLAAIAIHNVSKPKQVHTIFYLGHLDRKQAKESKIHGKCTGIDLGS